MPNKYKFDGKKKLEELAIKAGYSNILELVADNTLFIHPDTVLQTKNKNIFQIIRNFSKRGQIILDGDKKIMCCDNTGPQHAIEWALGGMKKIDIHINHVYSDSKNVKIYTSLANLCATPSFVSKLTDTDEEIKKIIRYRVFDLYGFFPEIQPIKPNLYDGLKWMNMEAPIPNLEKFYRTRLSSCSKSRTTVSAREIGWFFSDYVPDMSL